MKEKTWNKILIGISFILLTIVITVSRGYKDSISGTLTGRQALKAQEMYMTEFEVYANDIDTVMTLYLTDSIQEEDFLNHLSLFQEQLYVMQTAYTSDMENYLVRTGTHTYDTKRGCEAVKECYNVMQNLLDMMKENYQDKDALSYKYLAYHQEVISTVSDYMTAKKLVFEQEENHE